MLGGMATTYTLPVDAATERLARAVAEATGKPVEAVVREAIEAKAVAAGLPPRRKGDFETLLAIARRAASLPVLDPRTPDEIIGYDEFGLPR